ncbi:MAG TPA: rhodanese-like domain-containing protein [Cyclobacteriaceae bacterium]|nr:rhodanese-like domain-containing protein [Cyclobacteriaceae bacterium]
MIDILKRMFNAGPSVDYASMVKEGGIILDVRTKGEYSSGHIKGSLNIEVGQLGNNLHRLPDKTKTIITCCASGMRSGVAKNMLIAKGYKTVHNGGGWVSLREKI